MEPRRVAPASEKFLLNAVGLSILAVALALIVTGSRWRATLGMLVGVIYLTQFQQFNVGGFNLYAFRLVELVGFVRVLSRREISFSELTRLDKALIAFVLYTVTIYMLRATDGFAYRIGWGVDAFLSYFTFRGLLQNSSDLRWLLRAILALLLPYAFIVIYESVSNNNLFSIIGGRMGGADMMREGRMRAAGSFRHASLMGTLGASFLPLFIGLTFQKDSRKHGALGVAACLGIVWASNSGGPASGVIVGVAGWLMWIFRNHMKRVRWGLTITLAIIWIFMKAPIWYLIAKVSAITGGDGWHRSRLMEQGFNHIGGWWLAGMPIQATQNWFPYYIHGTGGADITNQYLSYGLVAGIGSMGLFVYLLVQAFRSIGDAQANCHSLSDVTNGDQYLLWGLGVMLVVHAFTWIGITYFDQTYALWYLHLAALSAVRISRPQIGTELRTAAL